MGKVDLALRYRHALEQLPASSICEPWIWKISSMKEAYAKQLFTKVMGDGVFVWHPKYLEEVGRKGSQRGNEVLHSVIELFFTLVNRGVGRGLQSAEGSDRLRYALHGLNFRLIEIGLLSTAFATARTFKDNPRSEGERLQIAKSMNDSGIMYRRLECFDEALACYEIALPLYRSAGDYKFAGNTYYNRGCVYQFRNRAGDMELARAEFAQALRVFKEIGLEGGVLDTEKKMIGIGD